MARIEEYLEHEESHNEVIEKEAASPEHYSEGLKGRLVVSDTNWLLLSVPNSLMRGLYEALHETGIELPATLEGRVNAHISVMTGKEVESIGGPGAIKQRGEFFSWNPKGVYTVKPRRPKPKENRVVAVWERVWFLVCHSRELSDLRKSYGLPGLMYGNHKFHITFAVKVKKDPQTKAGSVLEDFLEGGDSESGSMVVDALGWFAE